MSFDLAFYTSAPEDLTPERLAEEIAAVLGPAATAEASPSGTPIWNCKSPETGVTFRLEYHTPATSSFAHAKDGSRFSGLTVNVNYVRPKFVGIEALASAGALAGRLGLLIPDPRTPPKSGEPISVVKTEPALMNLTIEQWMEGNRWAINNAHKLTSNRPPFLDPERSMYFWRFQRMRQQIQKSVGNKAIVPSSRVIRMASSGEVVLMSDWANGLPAVFPQVEVFLLFEAKSMDDPNAKVAWTPAKEVIDRLGPILGRFEHPACDLIGCKGVPPSGPMREAFDAIPRFPLAGAIEDIGLNFVDEPAAAETAPAA